MSKLLSLFLIISISLQLTESFFLDENENGTDIGIGSSSIELLSKISDLFPGTGGILKQSENKLFGSACNFTNECARQFHCLESKCRCPEDRTLQPRFLWSSSRKITATCLIRAGGKCGRDNNKAVVVTGPNISYDPDTSRKYSGAIKKWGHRVWNRVGGTVFGDEENKESSPTKDYEECVENSRCILGVCVCRKGYFQNDLGLCTKMKSMFEKCSSLSECDKSEMLQCGKSGRCSCYENMVFDIRTLKCHLPVGAKCDELEMPGSPECVPRSECGDDGSCTCRLGYRKAKDGSCGLDHGFPCDAHRPCADEELSCREGRCLCRFWAHQYYDESSEQCLGKVGAPCGPFGSTIVLNCTENAICSSSSSSYSSPLNKQCNCIQTYAEDASGRCVKSFEAECDKDEDCDPVSQLSCVNYRCQCPDELQIYHPISRQCRGILGSRCSKNETLRANFRSHGVPLNCIKNATCRQETEQVDGRCVCKNGYKENNSTCIRVSSKYLDSWDSNELQ